MFALMLAHVLVMLVGCTIAPSTDAIVKAVEELGKSWESGMGGNETQHVRRIEDVKVLDVGEPSTYEMAGVNLHNWPVKVSFREVTAETNRRTYKVVPGVPDLDATSTTSKETRCAVVARGEIQERLDEMNRRAGLVYVGDKYERSECETTKGSSESELPQR